LNLDWLRRGGARHAWVPDLLANRRTACGAAMGCTARSTSALFSPLDLRRRRIGQAHRRNFDQRERDCCTDNLAHNQRVQTNATHVQFSCPVKSDVVSNCSATLP
jgi:hypothetical protein